tara:strand:- start:2488 stop:4662 length:2175 start_codon:yes stop_codon:yes gene_type:complete
MAIPILNHLDLRSASELQNAILHKTTEGSASNVEGKIIYDTGTDTIKFYNGSSWINLDGSGDIGAVTAGDGLTGGGSSGTVSLAVNVDDSSIEINSDTVRVKASGITNAMLAGSISPTKLSTITTANKVALSSLDIDGGTDVGEALVDADLMIVDNGAGGTNRKATMSRLKTYMQNNLTFTTNTNTVDMGDGFVIEDGDGTEVTVTENKQVKFVEGGGIDINFTDTDSGADGDEFDLTFTVQTLNQDTTGNAATATALETARNLSLTGDVTATLSSFDGSGNVSAAATIASGAVHHSMLSDDIISGQGALTSGLASTDELMISDAGTVKRMDVSVIQSYMQNNLTFSDNNDVNNANLLTALANLESTSGAANENITIGTDSGDTIVITGNLQVSGTTTTVNSTTVNLNDHNIVLDSGNSTSAVVDGAGITLEGGSGDDATFTYNASTNAFDFKLGSSFEDIKAAKVTATSLDISGNVDIDGTLEADAITVNGTALNTVIAGVTVSNATLAATTTVTNSTANTAFPIVFHDESNGLLDDTGTLTYNPSSGKLVAPGEIEAASLDISGNVDVDGTLETDALTINGTTSVAFTSSDHSKLDGIASSATANAAASQSEVQNGTNTTKFVTPDTLASRSVHATIDVSNSTFTSNLYAEIAHNLSTEDIIVQLFDATTKETVYADVARTDKDGSSSNDEIKITFASAPSNDIEVLITSLRGSTAGTVAYS